LLSVSPHAGVGVRCVVCGVEVPTAVPSTPPSCAYGELMQLSVSDDDVDDDDSGNGGLVDNLVC